MPVVYTKVGESSMIKISISIADEQNSFLDDLVKRGKAANRSHAVRLCITTLVDLDTNGGFKL
jgi:Arc/MetJ-type ribon-helix-helix transcriptional regulator